MVCQDQVTQAGSVTTVCQPVAATDAIVLIALLVIVLLLLPDFAEVAIPGLISLRRRVAETERRQDTLEQRLEATAQASASVYMPLLVDEAALDVSLRRVRGEEEGVRPVEEETPIDPQTAVVGQELLTRWERLDAALRSAQQGVGDPRYRTSREMPPLELIEWARDYEEELNYVRAARNAIAHGQPIDPPTLDKALELARAIEEVLPQEPPLAQAVRFEGLVREWLEREGYEIDPRSILAGAGFDFFARSGGQQIVIDVRLLRNRASAATLRAWVNRLLSAQSRTGSSRAMLVVSAPGLTTAARQVASVTAVDVYVQTGPAAFELIA